MILYDMVVVNEPSAAVLARALVRALVLVRAALASDRDQVVAAKYTDSLVAPCWCMAYNHAILLIAEPLCHSQRGQEESCHQHGPIRIHGAGTL